MIRVAVAGAHGRMGQIACAAVANSAALAYVGGLVRTASADTLLVADVNVLFERFHPEVLLDFTLHPFSVELAESAVVHGVRPVIGVSGWSDADRTRLAELAQARGLGAMLIPNFSIGAVLMMQCSELVAKYFPTVEIVEMHHDGKRDAPSGTARMTAQRIVTQGVTADVPIHSVRLRGAIAHQEVRFGNAGELLTIGHDALSRECFAAGMVAACKAVMGLRGLVVGLDSILDEME